MAVTIEKTFRFDAGHRALGFKPGKEETLHGHTWWLRLVVEARGDLGPLKTIFDTNELSRVVKPIIDRFDHAFIIWGEDPLYDRLAEICRVGNIAEKLIRVDFNPTVEGLVEHLFHLVKAQLSLTDAALVRAELSAAATLRATFCE